MFQVFGYSLVNCTNECVLVEEFHSYRYNCDFRVIELKTRRIDYIYFNVKDALS